MNWKVVILAGLAYYVTVFIIGFAAGPVIHEGVLEALYDANAVFWRPELNQDPPDIAALMPRWIVGGLFGAFVVAGVFDKFRSALSGTAVMKGVKFGFAVALLNMAYAVGYSGIFNLPNTIWAWWIAEAFVYYLVGGAVLGWVTQKLSTE